MPMINAIYGLPQLPEYAGNPLLEALPHFVLAENLVEQFPRRPYIGRNDRSLPKAHRMLAVSRLYNYLEFLPPHYDVIDQLGMMLRAGYVHRNPSDANYKKAMVNFYRKSKEGDIVTLGISGPSTAPSCALFGTSGVGKSSIVERYYSFLPQIICHQQHGFIQIVWLKLDCPLDGGLKALLLNFLSKVDQLLDTPYSKLFNVNSTVDSLLLKVVKVAVMHHVGTLIIDEIQHLLDAPGVSKTKMLNFFVTLSNEAKIPMLTMGTPKSLQLLQGTFREARRVADSGCFIWSQLARGGEWDFFLDALFQYQWTTGKATVTKKLNETLFYCTQGIHALVVRLFQMAQIRAIQNGLKCITPELIRELATEKFKLVEPMLVALRNNNEEEINKYDDLIRTSLVSLDQQLDVRAHLNIAIDQKSKNICQISERMRAISMLLEYDLEESLAGELIESEFAEHPKISAAKAVINIIRAGFPSDHSAKAVVKKPRHRLSVA